ncbi:MAG TPA: FtsX-like permease family protein [Terriglobales bacterium]|jgi:putative ABC transport system permease protein|nr:FtsX-like permease family protein [Terriglobales bacterium]
MAIPISYNIRNLKLRKGLTIMTALGIALTVTTAVFLMALLAGLKKAFMASGDPVNVLVMRKGSTAELSGGFDADLFPTLKTLPGIAKDGQGEPLASGEWVVVVVLPRKDGTGEVNVSVRGLMPAGVALRLEPKDSNGEPKLRLVEGRWFTPGQREVVVGKSIHDRFNGANVGDTMDFAKGQWKVVGVFDSGGTAYDSELWGDVNQIAADFDRQGGFASAYLRATDPVAADALKHRVSDDQRLKLEGTLETEYYEKQTSSGGAIKFIGTFVAIIMAIGSSFAAMNTMYAAVAYRSKEIATLRIIGFSRPSILTSFVIEALLLSLLGAIVGIVLILPFNGMSTGIGNSLTFSETVFSLHLTWEVAMAAVIFALIMGLLGGFAPAWHAARQDILTSLRA